MIEHNIAKIFDIVSTYNAKVLGVTKTVSVDVVNRAAELGLGLVGESKVQELESKIGAFSDSIKEVHFIGRLQSNKVSKCVEMVSCIQSVDSLTKAEKIEVVCGKIGKIMNVYLQVNISKETNKAGFSYDEIFEHFEKINSLKHIVVLGLMTIGSNTEDKTIIRNDFRKMRLMAEEISKTFSVNKHFKEISMGMSHDFRIALDEGATMVRLGSVIFGKRCYQ